MILRAGVPNRQMSQEFLNSFPHWVRIIHSRAFFELISDSVPIDFADPTVEQQLLGLLAPGVKVSLAKPSDLSSSLSDIVLSP